jgi:hypothetical protein
MVITSQQGLETFCQKIKTHGYEEEERRRETMGWGEGERKKRERGGVDFGGKEQREDE